MISAESDEEGTHHPDDYAHVLKWKVWDNETVGVCICEFTSAATLYGKILT